MSENGKTERHPLRSGIPCMKHRCVECCIETRMPLSSFDIERILKLGYRLNDFAVRRGGSWQLRNSSGKCVFLSEGGCKIYPYRPEGCRLYPLVYDEDLGSAVIDTLCVYGYEFEVSEDDIQKLLSLLESIEKENRQ